MQDDAHINTHEDARAHNVQLCVYVLTTSDLVVLPLTRPLGRPLGSGTTQERTGKEGICSLCTLCVTLVHTRYTQRA